VKAAFDADAIVVGGGPAGLAGAIALGRRGCRVILVERRMPPLDKPCGEGLMPSGLALLGRLGVQLGDDVGRQFRGIRYVSQTGVIAEADFRVGPGRSIRRTELSAALLAKASELSTVALRFGVRADIERRDGQLAVRVGSERLSAPLIVAADGLHSKLRAAVSSAPVTRRHWRWGMRQHFAVPPWSDFVEVHWGPGVEAYVTPIGSRETGLAFLWHRRFHRRTDAGSLTFSRLLALFPGIAARLAGATTTTAVASIGPLEQRVSQPTSDGVVLIGDASGYLDAITGEGLSLAFAQALALEGLAERLAHATAALTTADLADYAAALRRIAQPYKRMTSLALLLSQHRWVSGSTIRALRASPALFEHGLMANMGLVPITRFWRR
jgi:flavin-dependent dehydrogenase